MFEQGEPQSTGNMRFALLKGLPADYKLTVQSLQLPQQKDLTWDEIVAYLEDFVEANPTVLGAGLAGPSTTSSESTHATSSTSQDLCKNYSMRGSCPNGDDCSFRHVHPPGDKQRSGSERPKCTHCGKTGHLQSTCFSKHGRPDWHKEKYPDRGKNPDRGNASSKLAHSV